MVDDTRPEIGIPAQSDSDQTSSDLNRAGVVTPAAPTIESSLVPVPTNGSSPRKIAANRSNAQKSTGPKTSLGKRFSSWNSTRHGLLAKGLPPLLGKSKKQFTRLLRSLQKDLDPVGTLEEMLVEKIAQDYWRLGVAARYEAEDLSQASPFKRTSIERIFKYQTTINRQLFQAMNQLERLQRLRKGDNVPAPLSLQVLHDALSPSDQNDSEA